MTQLAQLWIPIVLSAVLVFLASSVIHMLLKWHNGEYRKLPNEDAVRDAIRAGAAGPGQYGIPHCQEMKEMQSPEMMRKFTEGPVALLVLRAPGPPKMGGALLKWFIYGLAVALIVACLAARGAARRRGAPGRRPRGRDGVPRVWRRLGAECDLDGQAVVLGAEGAARRVDLRRDHRRHVRLALAAIDSGQA